MGRYHSYLNTAVTLLSQYKGLQPFADFSKDFFSRDKKYGSSDRKQISHLCYCYFRPGKSLPALPVEERILAGLFLCSDQPNKILEALKPAWNNMTGLIREEKYSMLAEEILSGPLLNNSLQDVFPWSAELSDGIDIQPFAESFFIQPDLFLRLRPGKESIVAEKLASKKIDFQSCFPGCISLPNSSKIQDIIELNREAAVQDYNSQKTGDFLKLIPRTAQEDSSFKVWDCCAASGGKSIMALDILGNIDLTVSDIRGSILANLEKRFRAAGIKNYTSRIMDLSQPASSDRYFNSIRPSFDLVIADVPCTGSGTWSRTPEQLFYFKEDKIDEYASKQRRIISNAADALKPGAYFLYCTCSVFKKENEDQVVFLQQQYGLELIKQEVLKGYDKRADTLFAALLKKAL